jgi:peptidoglycan/LPS O-acetylase OafA/YrhL
LAWCVLDRFGRSSLGRADFPISFEKDTCALPQLRHPAYIPGIDGLRAVAVLSVMLYHLNPRILPGGFVGVDVFFAISGFVVTLSIYQSKFSHILSLFSYFYARRLLHRAGSHRHVAGGFPRTRCLRPERLAQRGNPVFSFYQLPPRFWELGIGVVLARSIDWWAPRLRQLRTVLAGALSACALAGIAVAFVLASEGDFPFPWVLPPAGGAAFIFCMFASGPRVLVLAPLLGSAPTLIGKWSYSLYLWALADLLPDAVNNWIGYRSASGRSRGHHFRHLAVGSYYFVEQPFRRPLLLRRLPPFASAMAAENQIADDDAGVVIWDPAAILCDLRTCNAFDGRLPLFFDGGSSYRTWK